ncbi:hypothetical protein PISMIDRAFT_674967 [Pisolithus microcarpus 441]|uniref:Uncharacterized protein n=1 Tax=Pisolithus microcarpus 441 TaxID=765257 RepID=A0A0C9ZMJ5_9AGAM|nr:hypothetical protein PISMIDRAFT_674967 [Pisolithus microcarpus 441]
MLAKLVRTDDRYPTGRPRGSTRNGRTLALSTSLHRLPHLTSIADSFYIVSRMGTTEPSVKGFVNSDIITRNRKHNSVSFMPSVLGLQHVFTSTPSSKLELIASSLAVA